MMSAFASGWNVIFSKKTLEENNYDLRKVFNIPGTGPFKTQRRVENEIWVMERNQNYWNKGLPYLDGIEFYHLLPFSPELGAAILSGRVDYARALDPATCRKAAAMPGLSTAKFYQSVIHATWINAKRKPFDDPRVRRALHLLFEKQVLVDVVKDVSPLMIGRLHLPVLRVRHAQGPACQAPRLSGRSPPPRSRRPNRCWPPRARAAACGHWISWCATSTTTSCSAWPSRRCCGRWVSSATCGRLSNRCGSATRRPATSIWRSAPSFRRCSIRRTTSTRGTAPTGRRTTRSGTTPSSTSCWIRSTSKSMPASAMALIRQAEDIMEQDPPLVPVAWENILDVWYNYVKGHNPKDYFGIYDVVRFDTFWLDKA